MTERKIIRLFPSGTVTPPPSKSLAHRAAICAWLASRGADEESILRNMGASDDIDATLSGIAALGGRWQRDGGRLHVLPTKQKPQSTTVDCGESASTLRFLLPLAALGGDEVSFTGRGRLMERPLDVFADLFARAGVNFRYGSGGATVRGPLKSGVYHVPGDVSSQFVSGLLFALPLTDGDSEIRLTTPLESRAYVDMTIDVMRCFGVEAAVSGDRVYHIRGGQSYRPATYTIEADYSQAAVFLAAAVLGRDVACAGLHPQSRQGDRAILRLLEEMGAKVRWRDGLVRVEANGLKAVTVDAREIPDLIPPLAALCCYCAGVSRIVNAGRLRFKESDRLSALASELAALGARVEEGADSLTIYGTPSLRGGAADAHGDHRIAMAVAVAAIRCENPVTLSGAESVRKSYPAFWDDFEKEARL